jgi:ankyrin repeat protein
MPTPRSTLPPRPSLEQLRKQAKELLRGAREHDAAALARFAAVTQQPRRIEPAGAKLAAAQLVIAREYGFESWGKLVHHVEGVVSASRGAFAQPLIRPVELRGSRPYTLADRTVVTTGDVWRMFVATRAGDISEVRALIARAPGLAVVEYNYTPPIHFAVREGHLPLVELLVDKGADLGYRSYPFGDALLTIAEDHEHAEVVAYLGDRLSRRFVVGTGNGRIIEAARAGDLTRLSAEVARDPGLARAGNETGDTPLHHAAENGHLEIVRFLLRHGAHADAVRGDGRRPIHLALMKNWLVGVHDDRAAIVETLLGHGAEYTPFIAALRGDHEYLRDALASDRSAANHEDTCHHRPLSAAVRRGDMELVRVLLQHGADPRLPEEGAPHGHALWIAVHDGSSELARLLLEHGADPNGMVDSSGTPMGLAVAASQRHPESSPHAEMRALLRAHGGVDTPPMNERLGRLVAERRFDELERLLRENPDRIPNEEGTGGEGVLMGPASAGDHELLALLMKLGARVPRVTKWAPYYYFKHEATARFLLEHGMDPDHMNWHRFTLLHHMAAEGEVGKARLLIEHGANLDAVDEEYRSTPLGVAARAGRRETLELLLDAGADPNASGAPWSTPLAWIRKKRHDDLATLLRTRGAER